jgi:uncharacterized protein (DUF1810 family)
VVSDPHNLQRFIDAQDGAYESALAELRRGSKQTHWMWFIFPQLRGLGLSPTAQCYGIASLEEAEAYLEHPLLGSRLRECVDTILSWHNRRAAEQILGPVDALKLRSCLTLFDRVETDSLFASGLASFFAGEPDERTLALLDTPL